MRKTLLIVIGVLLLGAIGTGIWYYTVKKKEEKTSGLRNINVASLSSNEEKKIATIYYPGAKVLSDAKQEGSNNKAVFETTDSMDGAANIYYQDLLNRYKSYNVTKKTVKKTDALNKKATVITCSGKTGKITITIWAKTNGMTQVEVVTSGDFK